MTLTREHEPKGCPSCNAVAATWITDCDNPIHMPQANAYIHTLEDENDALRAQVERLKTGHHLSCDPAGYTDTGGVPHPPECHPECRVQEVGMLTAQLAAMEKERDEAIMAERERCAYAIEWQAGAVSGFEREELIRMAYTIRVGKHKLIALPDYKDLANRLQQQLAQMTQERDELLADRSIKWNGARMLARFVLNHLPKKHTTHNEGEQYNVAKGFLESDVPHTTPWLLEMMEVARLDKHDLPQQLYQLRKQLAASEERVKELEGTQ